MQIEATEDFVAWLNGVKDLVARARIQARIARLIEGNPGVHRNLPGGVCEMKIDVGPGYRLYYTQSAKAMIILLCGGSKSTQSADIRKAQAMVKEL